MSNANCSSSTVTTSPRAGDSDWRQGKSVGEKNLYFFHHRKDTMDIKFLLGAEKQEIMAHSNILILQSAEFEQFLLTTRNNRDKNEPIELPQYDPKSFEWLLKAIYLGELPEDDDVEIDFIELVKLVRTFKPDLEAVCKSRVATGLKDWKTALKALELEDLEIKQTALEIICQNSDDVLKSVEFLNLPLNSLKEILKLDELDVGETKIFQALIRWAENKSDRSESRPLSKDTEEDRGKRIRNTIGDLIHLIRFPLMPQQYFLKEVAPLKILSDLNAGKISMCMLCVSYSKDCDHRLKCCDPSPFSCKHRRNNSERSVSSSTHSEEPASMMERSRAAIPVIDIDDSDHSDDEVTLEPMQIPKTERVRRRIACADSAESAEEPERKILKVSGNAGLSIARQIEDNTVDAPIHEDANPATNEATSKSALMDQGGSLTTPRGSEEDSITIPSCSIHPMTAIKVTPGMKTFMKENSWVHLQTESLEGTIWFDNKNQGGNIMFLDHGFTLHAYTIESTPTNELLKLKYSILGFRMPNDLPCFCDIWHPSADLVNYSPILFSLQGTSLNAYDLQNGQKVVAEMDLTFPGGDIGYGKLEIVDEFICIENFARPSVPGESDEDESIQYNWGNTEMVQELLILKLSHSPIRVQLIYRIIIPEEVLRADFKDIKRRKRKLYFKTHTNIVEIFDIWDLINTDAKKILRGKEHDADTFKKHPNLTTVIIERMPSPQYQFDNTEGLKAIISKTSPLHVLAKNKQKYSIYNVEHPEKPVRTISYWKGKAAGNDKIIHVTCFENSTFPYLMCHYESSGFVLIKANEPGPITNSVLKTSHIFPMEKKLKKSGNKTKRVTRINTAKNEIRWPNWRFERSEEYKRKIGICSIDTDNKMIHVSIHDMEDLTKNIEKLPPLKIEEWGIPEESVKELNINLFLNDNFVRVRYRKQGDSQNFIYCR